jgi:hypothetical protein
MNARWGLAWTLPLAHRTYEACARLAAFARLDIEERSRSQRNGEEYDRILGRTCLLELYVEARSLFVETWTASCVRVSIISHLFSLLWEEIQGFHSCAVVCKGDTDFRLDLRVLNNKNLAFPCHCIPTIIWSNVIHRLRGPSPDCQHRNPRISRIQRHRIFKSVCVPRWCISILEGQANFVVDFERHTSHDPCLCQIYNNHYHHKSENRDQILHVSCDIDEYSIIDREAVTKSWLRELEYWWSPALYVWYDASSTSFPDAGSLEKSGIIWPLLIHLRRIHHNRGSVFTCICQLRYNFRM